MRLQDRGAIVTGGGRGIGRAIALRLAKEGARVAVAGRTASTLREVAGQIEAGGGAALPVPADVSDEGQVRALVERAEERLGPVDILVNNAGQVGAMGDFFALDAGHWLEAYRVNYMGTLFCCREVLKRMMPRRRGAIVNISSIAAATGFLPTMPYNSTKAAVNNLTIDLARLAGPSMVRVNALLLGPVVVDRAERLPEGLRSEDALRGADMWAMFGLSKPPGGMLVPEEIAGAVAFLASDEASGITGQLIQMVTRLHE